MKGAGQGSATRMEPVDEGAPHPQPEVRESSERATRQARRQLRAVLVTLGLLDVGVVLLVVGLAEARTLLGLTTPELLLSILGGLGLVLAVRVMLAVRLRRRSGELL
jgi:hypothetical protein